MNMLHCLQIKMIFCRANQNIFDNERDSVMYCGLANDQNEFLNYKIIVMGMSVKLKKTS